jgi:hypothetical protein
VLHQQQIVVVVVVVEVEVKVEEEHCFVKLFWAFYVPPYSLALM